VTGLERKHPACRAQSLCSIAVRVCDSFIQAITKPQLLGIWIVRNQPNRVAGPAAAVRFHIVPVTSSMCRFLAQSTDDGVYCTRGLPTKYYQRATAGSQQYVQQRGADSCAENRRTSGPSWMNDEPTRLAGTCRCDVAGVAAVTVPGWTLLSSRDCLAASCAHVMITSWARRDMAYPSPYTAACLTSRY
jgi:hypothetical protein